MPLTVSFSFCGASVVGTKITKQEQNPKRISSQIANPGEPCQILFFLHKPLGSEEGKVWENKQRMINQAVVSVNLIKNGIHTTSAL